MTMNMNAVIANLFHTAPEIDNPVVQALRAEVPPSHTSRRYLECQVVLKSGYSMAGVLTTCNVDGFRESTDNALCLAAIAKTPDNKVLMAHHYFAASEIQTIVVGRPLPEQLVKPIRNGNSPIILGH